MQESMSLKYEPVQVVEDGVATMAVGEGEEGAELAPAAPLEKLTLPGDDGSGPLNHSGRRRRRVRPP